MKRPCKNYSEEKGKGCKNLTEQKYVDGKLEYCCDPCKVEHDKKKSGVKGKVKSLLSSRDKNSK